MKQFRIRKDDKVMVIAGKDQGKIGKVLRSFTSMTLLWWKRSMWPSAT